MAKSILQKANPRECYLCRREADKRGYEGELPPTGLNKHHFIHGTANRKQSERFGLWAYVCVEKHHIYGKEAPHANKEVNRMLHIIAQQEFESLYGHEKFMNIFQKNYVEDRKC